MGFDGVGAARGGRSSVFLDRADGDGEVDFQSRTDGVLG